MKNDYPHSTVFYFLVTNLIVLAIVGYAAILISRFPALYSIGVQEDGYLEWATFWAFLLSAAVYLVAARHYRNTQRRFPWFLGGLAIFCFLVAMEEISWGQRILGYRPPVYFLEENFQQEFNFHNIIATGFRKLILMLIIIGYGIAVPIIAQFRFAADWLERAGVIAPPIGLLPSFIATAILYNWYPWRFAGEWVEAMLAFGFLFSALPVRQRYCGPTQSETGLIKSNTTNAVASSLLVAVVGLASSALTHAWRDADPAKLQNASVEVEALKNDLQNGRVEFRCNMHRRLYTFVNRNDQVYLLAGQFAAMQAQGLPVERAEYLIDPWNSPYWIRSRCGGKNEPAVRFVYSFGPNRRRESSRTEILGDDVGAYVSNR